MPIIDVTLSYFSHILGVFSCVNFGIKGRSLLWLAASRCGTLYGFLRSRSACLTTSRTSSSCTAHLQTQAEARVPGSLQWQRHAELRGSQAGLPVRLYRHSARRPLRPAPLRRLLHPGLLAGRGPRLRPLVWHSVQHLLSGASWASRFSSTSSATRCSSPSRTTWATPSRRGGAPHWQLARGSGPWPHAHRVPEADPRGRGESGKLLAVVVAGAPPAPRAGLRQGLHRGLLLFRHALESAHALDGHALLAPRLLPGMPVHRQRDLLVLRGATHRADRRRGARLHDQVQEFLPHQDVQGHRGRDDQGLRATSSTSAVEYNAVNQGRWHKLYQL